jgi:putative chitinase
MRFDREIYFDGVRNTLFGGALEQIQVDGQNVILGLWEYEATGTPMEDIRWLAYLLATVYHECDKTMWSIEEYGQGAGYEYGKIDPETGKGYWGRGLVMITHRENYARASKMLSLIDKRDLEWHPEIALDSLISARIIFRGMAEGFFTSKKLGDYFNETTDDSYNARRIVNGTDKADLIAGYHHTFLEALKAASIDSVAA